MTNVVAHEGPDNLEVYRGTTEDLIRGQNFDLNGTPLSEDEGAMTSELVARLRTIQPGDVIQCGDGYHSDFRVSLACCKPMQADVYLSELCATPDEVDAALDGVQREISARR